jgi:L-threonylcarbamoyladenylate synthase
LNSLVEIKNSLSILEQGKTIAYPTDTVWGLGCDATNEKAVAEIYKIKQRSESKSLIILVSSFEMLKKYIKSIPGSIQNILRASTKPTTIIYSNPVGLANNVVANDNTVAIRIVKNDFCNSLIEQFGKPVVSTSANISNDPTPKSYSEISKHILDSVDYVVNLQRDELNEKSSTILKIGANDEIIVLRE